MSKQKLENAVTKAHAKMDEASARWDEAHAKWDEATQALAAWNTRIKPNSTYGVTK